MATRQIYSVNSDSSCSECLHCIVHKRRTCLPFYNTAAVIKLKYETQIETFGRYIVVFRSIVNDHRSNDHDPADCEATIEIRLETGDSFRNEWHRENGQSRRLLVTEVPSEKARQRTARTRLVCNTLSDTRGRGVNHRDNGRFSLIPLKSVEPR